MKHLVLAAAAAISITSCSMAHACYSDGYRAGLIQKLSSKGFVSKSYEGELVMDGIKFRSTGPGGNVWKFSARSKEVGQQLEQAMMTQRPVTVKYCQELFSVTTDTKYVVTSVTFNK